VAAVFGVDVGGTKVAVAAVAGAETTYAVEHPTELSSAEALLDGIQAAVGEVSAAVGRPEAIGVGMPSQVEAASGRALGSVNIPLEGVPVRDELASRFGVPVFVDNDANCAGLAEAQLVPDPPARYLVMLTLGTGVGGGVIIDGRIYRGATGLGAELGHVTIDANAVDDPPRERFPRAGSLEWLCSGYGLEREATRVANERPDSRLGAILAERGRVTGRDAVAAARDGDEAALGCFERHGRWLGMGIAGVVNTFEPEHVVIGGGLSRAADLFLETARSEAAWRALPALWERTDLRLARGGPEAGVIGAGVLARQELRRTVDTEGSGV
jgi:glucokinase